MKWSAYCLALFTLCSCGVPSASNTIAESAINTATAIEKSLPKECATEGIKAQITAIKTQITAITQACDSEKAEIRSDKIKWKTAFFGLLIAIAVYVIRKVAK